MTEPKYYRDSYVMLRFDQFEEVDDITRCRRTRVSSTNYFKVVEISHWPWDEGAMDWVEPATEEEFNDALQKAQEEINNV